ncbi:hypothetical protein AGMMS50212_14070 [Spirochaetia bacterium]|nr:hypothetical protein AGMMS50212_14070 [Spirochaetia bacterium]
MNGSCIKGHKRMKNVSRILLLGICMLAISCTTTWKNIGESDRCVLKIVPGTIITKIDGINLKDSQELDILSGNPKDYREQVITLISHDKGKKYKFDAEAEFDSPVLTKPYSFTEKRYKIHVLNKDVYEEYQQIDRNPSSDRLPAHIRDLRRLKKREVAGKVIVYKGDLSLEFTLLPDHEYCAQVILNEYNQYVLNIWDTKGYPW